MANKTHNTHHDNLLKLKLRGPVSCHKFDFQLLYSQTSSLWTPHYYGQLPLSLGKALQFSTPLIRTPINADNRHLFEK